MPTTPSAGPGSGPESAVAARLETWAARTEARVWRDGDWDCLMAVGDWIRTLTPHDPAARWRGAYDSPAGAAACLAAEGGMARLLDRALRPLGWIRTAAPHPGDIAVITLAGEPTRFGAIRWGRRWLMATRQGPLITEARARAAWTWPHSPDPSEVPP